MFIRAISRVKTTDYLILPFASRQTRCSAPDPAAPIVKNNTSFIILCFLTPDCLSVFYFKVNSRFKNSAIASREEAWAKHMEMDYCGTSDYRALPKKSGLSPVAQSCWQSPSVPKPTSAKYRAWTAHASKKSTPNCTFLETSFFDIFQNGFSRKCEERRRLFRMQKFR